MVEDNDKYNTISVIALAALNFEVIINDVTPNFKVSTTSITTCI